MKLSELFQDKYTVIFLLVLVLLVSVWVSRTYRNGGFGSWMAPSEGYGTGVIEGFDAPPPQTIPMTLQYDATQPGSASAGELILNRCEFVQSTTENPITMKYSFVFFTTTDTGNLKGGQTPAKTIKITIPTVYAANTNTNGIGISMRPFSSNTAIETLTSPATGSVTGIAAVVNGANLEITYTPQQTAADVLAGKYALELSGIKTPTRTASPATFTPTGNQFVTLESSAQASGSEVLVAVNMYHASLATKIVKIFKDKSYDLDSNYKDCRKITTAPSQLVETELSNTASTTGSATVFKIDFMLTNPFLTGDMIMIQLPNVSKLTSAISVQIKQGIITASDGEAVFTTVPNSTSYATFKMNSASTIAANTLTTLIISGLRTQDTVVVSTSNGNKIRTFLSSTISASGASFSFTSDNFLDAGEYTSPVIASKGATSSVGAPTSAGTASDGSTYVTSAASSVLISDVKRQMNWAVEAQKEYEKAYKELRSATTETAKTDAKLKYDVIVVRRNRLIASHPDSWYDGANWRYGDDGFVRKCVEPSNLSSNEGNCQNIYKMDGSGNLVKSAEGNNKR